MINDGSTVKELKDKFKEKFEGCLRIKDSNDHIANDDVLLSSLGVIGHNIIYTDKTSVDEFQEKVKKQCNLNITVRTPDDSVEVIAPIKLNSLRDLPKSVKSNQYKWFLDYIQESVKQQEVETRSGEKGKGMPTRYVPNTKDVEKKLNEWKKLRYYVLQEKILEKLFKEQYPKNDKFEEILLKVVVLNEFYSTNILNVRNVAKRIEKLSVDKKLEAGNINLVDKIASVKQKNGESIQFFSFATKYCSHHFPDKYPIYDKYVSQVLTSLRNRDGFCNFNNEELRKAKNFKDIIDEFLKVYNLIDEKTGKYYSYKEIDRYLWLLGKEWFKKDDK